MKTNRFLQSLKQKIKTNPWWSAAAALLVLSAVAWATPRAGSGLAFESHPVERADFRISLTEPGTLMAASEVLIRCEVEGSSRVIWLIEEGSLVKQGALLVELDSSELRERLTQQEISFQNSYASFVQARENLLILRSQLDSNQNNAELKLEFAESDLQKYIEGEAIQRQQNAESKITILKEELQRAAERLDWSEQLEEKGYATKTELEADQLKVKVKQIELEQAERNLELLVKYEHPRRLRQLESNVELAAMYLDRYTHRALSQLAQAEADLRSRQANLELAESRLNQRKEQLNLTKIYAPQDGMVVYAFGSSQRSDALIEEGVTVRQRQTLIKLPDISRMKVEVKVHESQVTQVRPGLEAYVTVDSMPDRRFNARVRRVALLPDSQHHWYNPHQKIYSCEVELEASVADLKPGVSAKAQIIIANREGVLKVPLQAVTTIQGQPVAFVERGKQTVPVPVEVGVYDERFIEITAGLKEGELVRLGRPDSFNPNALSESVVAAIEARKTRRAANRLAVPDRREATATQSPAPGLDSTSAPVATSAPDSRPSATDGPVETGG